MEIILLLVKANAVYKSLVEFDLDHKQVDDCILKEEIIEQEHNGIKFNLRRIAFITPSRIKSMNL